MVALTRYSAERMCDDYLALYERALAIHTARGPDDPDACATLVGLGRLQLERGHPAEATPWFERAVAVCKNDPRASEGLAQARKSR